MKTVRDIFAEVLAMKRRGHSLDRIRDYITETGAENGMAVTNERGGPNVAEFTFPSGEIISVDGVDWHHKRPASR